MDFEVDDLLLSPKKKIKSGRKGKAGERDVVRILNNRFDTLFKKNPKWGKFSRSVGSGNRWGQKVDLPEHAINTFTGDLCTPTNFKFVIESKKGYNEIDLYTIFGDRCRELDEFLDKVQSDAKKCNKEPLLIWKKDYKPIIAFVKSRLLKKQCPAMYYRDWIGLPLETLLKQEDHFWFA